MENVKIPLLLFRQIIDLLDYLTKADYDPAIRSDFNNVYFALLKKQQSLELRNAYAKIIFAEDDNARFNARMRYLQQKREIDDF